jgi:iron complex outermembrane receptor protein
VIGNRPANVPITNYIQGLSSDNNSVDRKLIDFSWSYKFNDAWKIHNGVTATFDNINFTQSYFAGSFDQNQNIGLVPWFGKRTSQGYNSFLDLTGEFNTYGIDHKVLFGTDHYLLDYTDIGYTNQFGNVALQNIYNPSSITWLDPFTSNASVTQQAKQVSDWTQAATATWNGVYLQDQMKIMQKFHLLLGGRYDWAESNGGAIIAVENPGFTLRRSTVKDQKFSPRVGLVYDATDWLAIYGNYVESLGNAGGYGAVTFNFDATGLGSPLHASSSSSYEGGIKVQAFDKRLMSTLAFFEIDKSNMATRDLSSSNPFAMANTGKARSRGIEFDVTGAVTKDLSIIGSYAYTDARFISNNDGLQGNLLANVPRNSGSIWAKYQLLPEHLSVGLGGNFRGDRQGDNQNTFLMPGYATMDTFIAYNFKVMGRSKLTTQLNVNNILDKRYFINSNVYDATPTLGVMPGQPITIMGSIRLEY